MEKGLPACAEPDAPDFVEPVEAWRAWRVVTRRGVPFLQSVIADTVWLPQTAVHAACPRVASTHGSLRHEAPGMGCICGIHGAGSPAGLLEYLHPSVLDGPRVFGRVCVWGRVVECTRGWRGSRAYPSMLVVPWLRANTTGEAVVNRVAADLRIYGCPVVVEPVTSPEDVALHAAAGRYGAATGIRPSPDIR